MNNKKIDSYQDNLKLKLPVGISSLQDIQNKKICSNKFFFNSSLAYISRSLFKSQYSINDDNFQTERDLFEKLFSNDSSYQSLVISGEGGIGKTRLMYELGQKAEQDGWIIFQVYPKFEGWENLCLEENQKYCLLFDSIEENIHFDNNILNRLNNKYPKMEIKIIANTRNTHFLNHEIKHSNFYKIDLNSDHQNEQEYLKYVTANIFEYNKIDLIEKNILITEFVNKPSFAVFLLNKFLEKKDHCDFQTMYTCNAYILEIFLLTLSPENSNLLMIENDIFNFLLNLPVKKNNISPSLMKKVHLLMSDGWIEYDKETASFQPAHNDTILDVIFIAYFNQKRFESDSTLKETLINIFNFGIKYSHFEYGFRSLDRLVSKTVLSKKSDSLMSALQLYIDELKHIKNLFMRSDILNNFLKFKLVVEHDIMSKNTREFTILLARIMAGDLTEEKKIYVKEFFDTWIKTNGKVWEEPEGIFIISVYFKLFGEDEFIIEKTSKYINKDKSRSGLDFIFIALVEYSNYTEASSKLIEDRLLQKFWKHYYDLIDNIIENAIENNEQINIEASKKIILEFINYYYSVENKNQFVRMYIKNKPENIITLKHESIKEYVNEAVLFSRFLKKSDGPLILIKQQLINWLYNNYDHESLRYLIKGYFDKGGDVKSVEVVLVQWINLNCQNEKARYVIPFYLDNGGKIDSVEECVAMWINSYPDKATYVIPSYLRQGGNLDFIREIADKVIQKNGLKFFVVEYLSAGGNFLIIEKKIIGLLTRKTSLSYSQRKNLFTTYLEYTKEPTSNFHILSILSEIFIQENYEQKITLNGISKDISTLLVSCQNQEESNVKKIVIALLKEEITFKTFHERVLEKISLSYECLYLFYNDSESHAFIDEEFYLGMHINMHPHLLNTGCYVEQYLSSNYTLCEIEDTLIAYLNEHTQKVPPRLYALYCEKRGDIGLLNNILLETIKGKTKDMLYYAKVYLQYGGDIYSIRSVLYQYLFAVQLGYEEVDFIYKYGLDEKLHYRIIGYLKYCNDYKHFYTLLIKYIERGGDLEQVEFKIIYFLKKRINENNSINELFEEYIEHIQNDTVLKEFVLDTLLKEVDKKDTAALDIRKDLFRIFVSRYGICEDINEIINRNYSRYKSALKELNIIGKWVEEDAATVEVNTLKNLKRIRKIEPTQVCNKTDLNDEDLKFKELLEQIKNPKNSAKNIFASIKNKFNDFDDIDVSLSQDGHILIQDYILNHKFKYGDGESNHKYILLCTKYLKTTFYNDALLDKIQQDVETFVIYQNLGLMKKLYKRILECRKIDLAALSPAEIIRDYPILHQEYFGKYIQVYGKITPIKTEYIEYLEETYINRKNTFVWLKERSYIEDYLTDSERDKEVDSVIIDILNYYSNKDPFVTYVLKYIRDIQDFVVLKNSVKFFIDNNGKDDIYYFKERLKNIKDRNKGLVELEIFLEVNT